MPSTAASSGAGGGVPSDSEGFGAAAGRFRAVAGRCAAGRRGARGLEPDVFEADARELEVFRGARGARGDAGFFADPSPGVSPDSPEDSSGRSVASVTAPNYQSTSASAPR